MTLYNRELNKGMKVFSQLYVGLKEQGAGKVDLGFATPFENNAAFRKRQETVDKWCGGFTYEVGPDGLYARNERGGYITKKIDPRNKIIDNKPRSGFRITDDVKRVYWGGGNVVWRVEDPEGFELEIQSQNLMAIIQTAGIGEGGLIPGYCLWGRDGKDNILLHEKSEEYKNAILAAETLKPIKQAASAERVAGTKYLLQDGSEAVYLGKFWVIRDDYRNDVPYRTYFHAKIDKYALQGKLEERKMGEPEAFDAVDVGTDDNHLIRLYKKAPLIRAVGEITARTPEECLNIVRAANGISYASTSMSGRIAFIHNTKFSGYKYVAEKIRESVFKNRLERITHHGNNAYTNNKRLLSAASFHGFYGGYAADATIIAYKQGEKLYSHFSEMRSPYGHTVTYHAGWPLIVTDKLISEFMVDQYALSHQPLMHFSNKVQIADEPIECIQIPAFETLEEIGEWFKQQYEEGNLLEVRVQPT